MFITINNTQLFYEIEKAQSSEKPTVLLIPGGPGLDHVYFKPFFSNLTDVANILYYDPRGCGQSDKGQPKDFTLKQWTDDVVQLVQHLKIENPILLGHSFGGFVAQNVVINYPQCAGGMILCNSAARLDLETSAACFRNWHGEESERVLRAFWNNTLDDTLAKEYHNHCEKKYNVTSRPEKSPRPSFNPIALKTFYKPNTGEGFHFNHLQGLRDVRTPTLILTGERDPILPVSLAQEAANHLPRDVVKFTALKACGHEAYLDQTQETFHHVRQFITSLRMLSPT